MNITNKDLKKRIIEISRKHKLSHIGSCLSVLPILEEIYAKKNSGDKIQLCGAHSHLAHLVVKESEAQEGYDLGMGAKFDAEELLVKHGIHCERKAGCDVSGGSLGHAGIALGIAIARPEITVYLVETDGALNEGSCWEALRLKKLLKIDNLKVIVNMNGFTAVAEIDREELSMRLKAFCPDIDIRYTNNGLPELEGLKGHYITI